MFCLQLKSDDRPPHVVSVLMHELSGYNETDWAEHFINEMVEGAPGFVHSPDALNILKEGLSLPCFDQDFIEAHLAVSCTLAMQLCSFCCRLNSKLSRCLLAVAACLVQPASASARSVQLPADTDAHLHQSLL